MRYSILGLIGGISIRVIHKMFPITTCNCKTKENNLFGSLTYMMSFKDLMLWEIGSINSVHALSYLHYFFIPFNNSRPNVPS